MPTWHICCDSAALIVNSSAPPNGPLQDPYLGGAGSEWWCVNVRSVSNVSYSILNYALH